MTPEQPLYIPFDYIVIAVCSISLAIFYAIAWVVERFRSKKLNKGRLFSVVDTNV